MIYPHTENHWNISNGSWVIEWKWKSKMAAWWPYWISNQLQNRTWPVFYNDLFTYQKSFWYLTWFFSYRAKTKLDGKTNGQTGRRTDRRTGRKPIVPPGFTGRRLISLTKFSANLIGRIWQQLFIILMNLFTCVCYFLLLSISWFTIDFLDTDLTKFTIVTVSIMSNNYSTSWITALNYKKY